MRTYVRGNCLSPDRQLSLSGAALKKYWLVDEDGCPIGKPFSRRSEVELYEASIGGEYQIVTGKVGRPRLHANAKEKERSRELKRNQDPDRKQYKSEHIRNKRKVSEKKRGDGQATSLLAKKSWRFNMSGLIEVQALASLAHGLTVRKACLYKGKGGWGYMFARNGMDEHWCHTLKQCREYLKAIGGAL